MNHSIIKDMELQIGITDHCNLRCIMCSQTDHEGIYGLKGIKGKELRKNEKGFMDFNLFKNMIKEIINNKIYFKTISLMWLGESLLHPNFFEMIDFMLKNNKKKLFFKTLTFSTNGTLLNKKISDIMINYLKGKDENIIRIVIVFSLDVNSKKRFIELKKRKLFETTIKNIKYLLNKKQLFNLCNLTIILQFLVLPENYDEIKTFIDYWRDFLNELEFSFDIVSDFSEIDLSKHNLIILKKAYGANQKILNKLHKECKIEFDLPRSY